MCRWKVRIFGATQRRSPADYLLTALNTLDLLKKGTSSIAQKARAASRILEAQVGTNPRIRVQRDDAFVLWDKIAFTDGDDAAKQAASCPEWVRRIICCAQWETEHAEEELSPPTKGLPLKVVLAILSVAPSMSPQAMSMKLADGADTPLTPVPLPAPTAAHGNRYEQRSTGTIVSSWAAKAGIERLEVDPALPGRGSGEHADDDRAKRNAHAQSSRGRRPSSSEHGARSGLVERPPRGDGDDGNGLAAEQGRPRSRSRREIGSRSVNNPE